MCSIMLFSVSKYSERNRTLSKSLPKGFPFLVISAIAYLTTYFSPTLSKIRTFFLHSPLFISMIKGLKNNIKFFVCFDKIRLKSGGLD